MVGHHLPGLEAERGSTAILNDIMRTSKLCKDNN
jgi:hypothetical protein